MSRTTKVKHVHREVLEDFALPEPHQKIVKVLAGRGNNLHEVTDESGDTFLASMPTKFRRNVWVKRGDFVVVEPIAEGDKVKAEIVSILYKEQIKFIKEEGRWPERFLDKPANGAGDDDGDEDADLFVNSNRIQVVYEESDDESSEDEDSDEDDDEGENEDDDGQQKINSVAKQHREEPGDNDSDSSQKNSLCSDEE